MAAVFEGTWAELLERSTEFAPETRLRLEVIDEVLTADQRAAQLRERLERRLAQANTPVKDTPVISSDAYEQAFAQIMDEKYRRLGFK